MAQKNSKTNNKTTKTTKTNNKLQKPPVETSNVEEVTPEVLEQQTEVLVTNNKKSGLDSNHQIDLLNLSAKYFHDDPNAKDKYGAEVVEKMDRITAAGIVVALADEATNGTSMFSTVMKTTAYPMIVQVANDMGITLPDMKKLEVKEDTVEVKSTDIKVSEETKEQLKEENAIEKSGVEKKIELDPKKVAHMGEEDLKNALTYLLVTGLKHNKSVKDSLVQTVDFMHEYRIEQARQAENSTDAMLKYEDRTMYDWLSDIFKYVKPTIHMKGIGKGMWDLTEREHSPLSAFVILRQALTDKKTHKVCWDDQSIADTVKAFIEVMCNNNIANEKAALEALDDTKRGRREIATKYETEIERNNNILKYVRDISFDIVEKYNTEEAKTDNIINGAFGRIWRQYYPECKPDGFYDSLYENLKIRGGIILNLFRAPGDKNAMYSEENITPVKELSSEEKINKINETRKKN